MPPEAASVNRSLLHACLPYIFLATALLISRMPLLPIAQWLRSPSVTIRFENVFGTDVDINHALLASPGSTLILVCLLTWLIHRMSFGQVRNAFRESSYTTLKASVALIFAVPMVKVFIGSTGGIHGYDGMPQVLATSLSEMMGSFWPAVAPAVGGLGAFIGGSNTLSNMMLSPMQFEVGQQIGTDPFWVVALQAVGGAAGNTICVHNVVAALAVAGMVGREGLVIRRTLLVFVYYAGAAGILGMLLCHVGGLTSRSTQLFAAITSSVNSHFQRESGLIVSRRQSAVSEYTPSYNGNPMELSNLTWPDVDALDRNTPGHHSCGGPRAAWPPHARVYGQHAARRNHASSPRGVKTADAAGPPHVAR